MTQHLTPDQQIKAIHEMMERSSRFLHISGFAGVVAGMIALLAAWIAQYQLSFKPDSFNYDYSKMGGNPWNILLLGLGTLILSFGLGFMLARRNARKHEASSWTATSRKMLGYFATPLLTGGLVIFSFLVERLGSHDGTFKFDFLWAGTIARKPLHAHRHKILRHYRSNSGAYSNFMDSI